MKKQRKELEEKKKDYDELLSDQIQLSFTQL